MRKFALTFFIEILSLILTVLAAQAIAQPGLIISGGNSVLDPNGDGYVSINSSGFSGDDYDVDEFEIPMFGIPIFSYGEVSGDEQIGPRCGEIDITRDKFGFGIYGALDANGNLIFRFRKADLSPAVIAYSILIDTDQRMGNDDLNSTSANPGFEISLTLINKLELRLLNIDGLYNCPSPLKTYKAEMVEMESYAGTENCGDEDYFLDFFVPFADLNAYFGITTSSLLRFVAATNISATCPLDGKISDVGGVDDSEYDGCNSCAFLDLTLNQCPTPLDSLCATCGGFPVGITQKPEIHRPVVMGDTYIYGTSEPDADIFIDIYSMTGSFRESDLTTADNLGNWTSHTFSIALLPKDSISVQALSPQKCNSEADHVIVTGNYSPEITGSHFPKGYVENSGPVQVDTVLVDDKDDAVLVGASIEIFSNFIPGEDILGYTPVPGIAAIYNPGIAKWTLTGTATLAAYQSALRNITYENTSRNPDLSIRTIHFIVNDGTQNSNIFSRDILIIPVNDPPVIIINGQPEDSLLVSTDEDTPLLICLTATDTEGNNVDVTSGASLTGNGVIDLGTPGDLCFTYIPELNFNGEETLKIFVCDDGDPVACDSLIVIVTVNPVNDAPVIVENGIPVDQIEIQAIEDTPIEVCLTVTDVDGDIVTLTSAQSLTIYGNADIDDPSDLCFIYTPSANYTGKDTVAVIVSDNGAPVLTDSAVVILDISPVNDPPVIIDEGGNAIDTLYITTDEDLSIVVCPDIEDKDGDQVDVSSWESITGNGTVEIEPFGDGCFNYIPNENFHGQDYFKLIVCDDGVPGMCDTIVVAVTINPVNDAPVIVENGIPVDIIIVQSKEDQLASFCIEATDVDGDLVAVTKAESETTYGSANIGTVGDLCFDYIPEPDFFGTDFVKVRACDNGTPSLCDSVIVQIEVEGVNDPPVIVDEGGNAIDTLYITTDEDLSIVVCPDIEDKDGDQVDVLSWESITGNGTVEIEPFGDGCFNYIPNENYHGYDYFKLIVCDDGVPGMCDTIVVAVTINPVNDAPVIVENGIAVDTIRVKVMEDIPAEICIEAIDIDGDDVIVSSGYSNLGTIDLGQSDDLCIMYTSPENYNGFDYLKLTACDNGTPVLCDNVIIEVEILPVNDAPIAVADTIVGGENTIIYANLLTNDWDPEGDALTINCIPMVTPESGSILINIDGTCSYEPASHYFGYDSFEYEICDSGNPSLCSSARVVIEIQEEIDPVVVYQAISPNNDGFNDTWIIQSIERFPNNKVQLFDRWNNLVFETTGYHNDWSGESNRSISSQDVPDGTYFYIVNLGDGSPLLKGYIVLKR